MKAILRAGAVFLAAALTPTVALAQTAPTQTPTPTPSTTANSQSPVAIGPADLQNFSLKGTVTRQADQPPVATPARPQASPSRPPAVASSPSRAAQSRSAGRTQAPAAAAPQSIPTSGQSLPSGVTAAPVETQAAPVLQQPVVPSSPAPEPAVGSSPFSQLPLWPWIAAAVALALAAGFLLWRRSHREPVAAAGQYDLLVPTPVEPEERSLARAPTPAPAVEVPPVPPAPLPPPAGTVTTRLKTAPAGVIASRLRPALELAFHPLRCEVDDNQVRLEFELELFNAGAAPARAIFAEASLLNASATQDAELAAFFSNAQGRGASVDVIQPMKRMSFRSEVVAPRAAVREYELAGRKAFVPVIAFNALYEWSGGRGQSSAAYLVGRDTQQEKLGPLRLDQGAREFSGLGARPLPSGVRT